LDFMQIDKLGSVAVMTWNYGPQNQFDTPFMHAIVEKLDELEKDDSVKGVVITAAQEKYFSTGLNIEYMIGQSQKGIEHARAFLEAVSALLIKTVGFAKPLVMALNGHAVAAGCIFAAAGDYRLMREDKGFVRLPEVEINIPFWPGMTALFKDMMPPQYSRDMFLTGSRFTPEQAKNMGYVDETVPMDKLVSRAVELAEQLGRNTGPTYTIIKRDLRDNVLRIMRETDPPTIEQFLKNMMKQ